MNANKGAAADEDSDDDVAAADKDKFELIELAKYWDEFVQDIIVDREKAEDHELLEMNQIWMENLLAYDHGNSSTSKKYCSSSGKKSILKSPSNFNMRLKPQSQGKSSVATSS